MTEHNDNVIPLADRVRAVRDAIDAALFSTGGPDGSDSLNYDGPGDGCRVPADPPRKIRTQGPPARRRLKRLSPEELAEKYPELPGESPDWILQWTPEISRRDLRELTAHGITLYPRSRAVYIACMAFLTDPTRKAFNAVFESMGDDLDDSLLLAAKDILAIEMQGEWTLTSRENMAAIAPMMNPYCHSLDPYDHQCIKRGRMVATLICRRCGQIRTRLCESDFNWMLRSLPEGKLVCASSTPGNHQIVALVEAVRAIS
jgi:hypothetical protein